MVIASGLGAQLGIGEESTYNTPVTVTRFLEFNSEGLDADVGIIESRGLGTGRFLRTDREKRFIRRAGGQVEFHLLGEWPTNEEAARFIVVSRNSLWR
jgi:hypothetical protein